MAPNGVSSRLPPAKGFAGSVVWQLLQSAASVSDLPRAIVSLEGSARAGISPNALHKNKVARIARILLRRPCFDGCPFGKSIARKATIAGVTSFQWMNSLRHKPKRGRRRTGTKLRFAAGGPPTSDLWCPTLKNRQILVAPFGRYWF